MPRKRNPIRLLRRFPGAAAPVARRGSLIGIPCAAPYGGVMRLTRSDEVFLSGARIAGSLIEHSQVRDRWTDPATLPRMTVGMLACHLGKQLLHTRTLVVTSGDGDLLPSAIEHYRRVRWVMTSDLDDSVNDRSA